MSVELFSRRCDTIIRFLLYLVLFWLPYSPAAVEACVILACVVWLAKRAGRVGSDGVLNAFRPVSTSLDGGVALFLGICLVSIPLSQEWAISLRAFFTKTLEWFVVFYLAAETFTERRHFHTALIVYVITSLATIGDAYFQYFVTGKDIFLGRVLTRGGATAGFHHANSLGGYLAVFLPVGLVFFLRDKAGPLGRRFGWGLSVMAAAGALVLTFSRASLLAAVCGILVVVFLRASRMSRWLILTAMILGIWIYVFIPQQIWARYRLGIPQIQNAMQWRTGVWEDSLAMIRERPVFGHGLNTYMRLFQVYRHNSSHSGTYAHNCYIQVAVETGLLGLGTFLIVLARLLGCVLRAARGQMPEGFLFGLAGLCGGLTAFMVHSFFDVSFYALQLTVYFWLMAGIAMAMVKSSVPRF